jgi:hypothetical protein
VASPLETRIVRLAGPIGWPPNDIVCGCHLGTGRKPQRGRIASPGQGDDRHARRKQSTTGSPGNRFQGCQPDRLEEQVRREASGLHAQPARDRPASLDHRSDHDVDGTRRTACSRLAPPRALPRRELELNELY